ncbi:MAG: type II toxin-antitoxin system RelE/ParE family toxin [Longimicrobiales bacterium]
MKPLRIHPEAEAELQQAFEFYEQQAEGLGVDFLDEVERVWAAIRQLPESGSPADEGIRRSVIRRFPFVVFYEAQADQIVVWAVAHQRRKPQYWRHRRRRK